MVLPPGEQLGLIKGKEPDSVAEWYASQVLDNLGIEYSYQVPIMGGSEVAGGVIVDFVLDLPFSQPAEVMGEYWHMDLSSPTEAWRINMITEYFKRQPLIWWDYELTDYQTAYATITRDLNV